MNIIARVARRFCQVNSVIPLSLPSPFEYTLASQQFLLYDIRFMEVQQSKLLSQQQKQHIKTCLKLFEDKFNRKNHYHNKQYEQKYIRANLIKKSEEIWENLSKEKINLQINLNLDSFEKVTSFLEIKPEKDFILDSHMMHELIFTRQGQTLEVKTRQDLPIEIDREKQLHQDLNKKRKNVQQAKEQIKQEMTEDSPTAKTMKKIYQSILSIGKKQKKSSSFERFYIVEHITGTFDCKMRYKDEVYHQNEIPCETKWYYLVQNAENQKMKKLRKRVFFDFQYWNRGVFFQVKDFLSDLQERQ